MQEFNKKTKIIISSIIIIGGILIIYTINKEQNYELDENAIVETKAEESKETEVEKEKIIIHISGAVKKEGIVELECEYNEDDPKCKDCIKMTIKNKLF